MKKVEWMNLIDYLNSLSAKITEGVKVELDNNISSVALADSTNLTIIINERLLIDDANNYEHSTELHAIIIFLHELGHLLDAELKSIHENMDYYKSLIYNKGFEEVWFENYKKNSLRAEVNAWKKAEALILENDLMALRKVMANSIAIHNNVLDNFKEILKHNHKAPSFHN